MNCLSVLLLFGFFVVLVNSRPSQSGIHNESDEEETEYETDEKALSEDSADEDSKLNEDSSRRESGQSVRLDVNNPYSYHERNLGESRADRSHSDISDYNKPYGNRDVRNDKSEETNSYNDIQNYNRQSSRYIGNEDATNQKETTQYLNNRNMKYHKSNRIHNNVLLEDPHDKGEVYLGEKQNEQGDPLFGFNAEQANQANGNNINSETNELSQHYSKDYQIHPGNKEPAQCKSRDGDHLYFNRDRRETEISMVDMPAVEKNQENVNSVKSQNEDEEMVIRNHIRNLSSDELDELLNSLSEEKRTLLKSIIADTDHAAVDNIVDNVNKREITKKTGAVEVNSCVESEQADSNDVHGDNSLSEASTSQSTEATDMNKHTDSSSDNTDDSNSKTTETNSSDKTGLVNQNDNTVQQKSNDNTPDVGADKTHAQIVPDQHVTTKNENKRETKIDDLADIVSFGDSKMNENDWITGDSKDQEECYNTRDDELSQFLDDEQSLAEDSNQIYKRNVKKQADYDSQMKSLEESFPKSETYDESAGPLIRVKRKNSESLIKKRSASILPDAKVAFFPAENDDEDNDEGNEFGDDGFYDRNPNFSSDDANNPGGASGPSYKLNDQPAQVANDLSKGTISVGSDTDNVLSGVEGVDENLMFSSGSRNRRTTENVSDVDDTNVIQSADSKSLIDENKAVSDMDALTYHENDSFGPLPRSGESESGRYKRIRRVKQSHAEVTRSDS